MKNKIRKFLKRFSPSAMLDRLMDEIEDDRVGRGPIIHDFPELGVDGQVSIDCIIRTSAGANLENFAFKHQGNNGQAGVPSLCVGAVLVEVNQYGLSLRWQPAQELNTNFLSPFGLTPEGKMAAEPTEHWRDDRHK